MAAMTISVMITLRGSFMAAFFLLRGDFERLLGIIDLRVGRKGKTQFEYTPACARNQDGFRRKRETHWQRGIPVRFVKPFLKKFEKSRNALKIREMFLSDTVKKSLKSAEKGCFCVLFA